MPKPICYKKPSYSMVGQDDQVTVSIEDSYRIYRIALRKEDVKHLRKIKIIPAIASLYDFIKKNTANLIPILAHLNVEQYPNIAEMKKYNNYLAQQLTQYSSQNKITVAEYKVDGNLISALSPEKRKSRIANNKQRSLSQSDMSSASFYDKILFSDSDLFNRSSSEELSQSQTRKRSNSTPNVERTKTPDTQPVDSDEGMDTEEDSKKPSSKKSVSQSSNNAQTTALTLPQENKAAGGQNPSKSKEGMTSPMDRFFSSKKRTLSPGVNKPVTHSCSSSKFKQQPKKPSDDDDSDQRASKRQKLSPTV